MHIDNLARYIVIPDTHVDDAPHGDMDAKAVDLLLSYIESNVWTGIICLGDFIDLGAISHHNKHNKRNLEGRRLKAAFDAARNLWLQFCAAARHNNPQAASHFLYGNHEDRYRRWLDENPVVEGLVDLDTALGLKETNTSVHACYPQGENLTLGRLCFTHGHRHGKSHAIDHARDFGCDTIYGHLHTFSQISIASISHGTISVWCAGTLTRRRATYHNTPKPYAWQQGFIEVQFSLDGQRHAVTPVPIHEQNGVYSLISPRGGEWRL